MNIYKDNGKSHEARRVLPAATVLLGAFASACSAESTGPAYQITYEGIAREGTVTEGAEIRTTPVRIEEESDGSSNSCGEVDESALTYSRTNVVIAKSVDGNPDYIGFDPNDLVGNVPTACFDASTVYIAETNLTDGVKAVPSAGPAQ